MYIFLISVCAAITDTINNCLHNMGPCHLFNHSTYALHFTCTFTPVYDPIKAIVLNTCDCHVLIISQSRKHQNIYFFTQSVKNFDVAGSRALLKLTLFQRRSPHVLSQYYRKLKKRMELYKPLLC